MKTKEDLLLNLKNGISKERFNIRKIGYIFFYSFLLILSLFLFSILFQDNSLYENQIKSELSKIYIDSISPEELDLKTQEILNGFNMEITSNRITNNCRYDTPIKFTNHDLAICFKFKEIFYDLKDVEKYNVIGKSMLISIIFSFFISCLILLFLLITDPKSLKNVKRIDNLDNIYIFLESKFESINNSMITFKLNNFKEYTKQIYILGISFIDQDPQNYFWIESKIRKQIETAKYLYLNSQATDLFLLFKELEMYYYSIKKNYRKLFSGYFLLITSKHFTSPTQLISFMSFFSIISAYHLKIFYEIPRATDESMIFYITQVVNVFSNLGGELPFETTIEMIFSIYLQIFGIIIMGILIGIINKEIK